MLHRVGWSRKLALAAPCCLLALAACGAESPGSSGPVPLGALEQPFINGDDDRLEYFELEDPAARVLMEQSVVALVPAVLARPLTRGDLDVLSTWEENHDLCAGEPFGDQPAAAFCTGVLVDWDLVLTSGHCVNVFPLPQVRAVFGFYFREPDELALTNRDVHRVAEVLVARDDQGPLQERLDYAWLRLAEPVSPPRFPVALRARAAGVAVGDAIVAINAGGGVPIKHDGGGRIRDLRDGVNDYFVADTDTSEGSSGGPAFDQELKLVGTLARGAPDYVPTAEGCTRTDRESDPALAREQFTYAFRSVEGLCEVDPERWLCDPSCDECEVPPPPLRGSEEGCTLAPPAASSRGRMSGALLALAVVTIALRRRR